MSFLSGLAVLALVVLNRDVADVVRHPIEDSVHVGAVVLVLDDLVANLARDAPEVGGLDVLGTAEQNAARLLVEPAREFLDRPVGALAIDAVDEVVALPHLGEDWGDLRGMGLHVVHAQDVVAAHVVHGAHEAVVLSEVAHEAEAVHVGVALAQARDLGEGAVGGVVVHEHELAVKAVELGELRHGELYHLGDAALGVVAGYDDGHELGHI